MKGEGVVLPKGSGAPPSRTKASCALLVTGFVRPFRVPAAQDLFKQHGENFKVPRELDLLFDYRS